MNNFEIDFSKKHQAELVKVQSLYRSEYFKQGLTYIFRLVESELVVHRTVNIPSTLQGKKTLFHLFTEALVERPIPESMLSKPNMLAKSIEKEGAGKLVELKLVPSKNGYLNIEEISLA
jgi:hypothetical protein